MEVKEFLGGGEEGYSLKTVAGDALPKVPVKLIKTQKKKFNPYNPYKNLDL